MILASVKCPVDLETFNAKALDRAQMLSPETALEAPSSFPVTDGVIRLKARQILPKQSRISLVPQKKNLVEER